MHVNKIKDVVDVDYILKIHWVILRLSKNVNKIFVHYQWRLEDVELLYQDIISMEVNVRSLPMVDVEEMEIDILPKVNVLKHALLKVNRDE